MSQRKRGRLMTVQGALYQADIRQWSLCVAYPALLLQDLYVYSERVTEHTALSEAARVRSEVTLVNNSGRRWHGTLRFALQLDDLGKSSSAPLKQAQPSRQKCQSADCGLDKTRGRQQQSLDSMAERGRSRQEFEKHWGCGTGKQRRKVPHSTSQHPTHGGNALHWTEAVEVPPGRTVFRTKDQLLRNPRLWWPINIGKQARLGIASEYLVLPSCTQEPCACKRSAQPAFRWPFLLALL